MCSKVLPTVGRVILVEGDPDPPTHAFPLTGWIPCSEVSEVMALFQIVQMTSDFEAWAGYQLAPTDPTDASTLGAWQILDESKLVAVGKAVSKVQNLAGLTGTETSTSKNTWIRFGALAQSKVPTTTSPVRGEVRLAVGYRC